MKEIKKYSLTALMLIPLMLGVVSTAQAATTDVSLVLPNGDTYEVGESFEVNITFSPSEKIYTAGVHLEYPPELLKAVGFEFNSEWMQLSQGEYDKIDNEDGLLVKTGGYGGGVGEQKLLGTATFEVLGEGDAEISLTDETIALDAQNENTADNLDSETITLNTAEEPESGGKEEQQAAVATQEEQDESQPATKETKTKGKEEKAPKEEVEKQEKESTGEVKEKRETEEKGGFMTATVASAWSAFTNSTFAVTIVALLLILAIAYFTRREYKKRKR